RCSGPLSLGLQRTQFRILNGLFARQKNRRSLRQRPTLELHACASRSNPPPRAGLGNQRAADRRAALVFGNEIQAPQAIGEACLRASAEQTLVASGVYISLML